MRNVVFAKAILIKSVHKKKWKKGKYHLPRGNFSPTTVCDSIALCYGSLMDNVALIQLQMNRQDSRIKSEEAVVGV